MSQLMEKLERERASAEAAALELATLSSAVQTSTDIMIQEKQALTQQVRTISVWRFGMSLTGISKITF